MSARRRVLVLAYYFPPIGGGGVNRTLKAVRAFAGAGWEPVVLTVDDAAWAHDPELLAAVPERARVVRLPNPDWGRVASRRALAQGRAPDARPGRGLLRRWLVPDLHVGWSALAAAFAAGFARSGAVQAVYSSGPPYSAHLAGWLARRLGLPWVADFRDAWTGYDGRQDFPRWRRALESRLEGAVLGAADRVLFASDAVRQRSIERRPGLAARSETVLTGFDPAEFAPAAGVPPDPGPVSVVHAGGALRDQKDETLAQLLDALRRWRRRAPADAAEVRLAFVGGEAGLSERIAQAGLAGWVDVEPALPRRALPARLARAHRCLYLAPAGRAGADPVPGKLFDAAGADRRLLALSPRGGVTGLIDELDLGEWVDPRDAAGLVRRLDGLRREARYGLRRPAARGRTALDAARSQARMVAALETVVAARRREEPPWQERAIARFGSEGRERSIARSRWEGKECSIARPRSEAPEERLRQGVPCP